MILSVSRRTDIPAYYPNWLVNRFKAGEVFVRNPYNSRQVSRIELNPETVDCIVFWTKNPTPLIHQLETFSAYTYMFQITLNPYDKTIEPGVPPKKEIIKAVKDLSLKIGKERIIWRYDPILVREGNPSKGIEPIDYSYHIKWFSYLAQALKDHVDACVVSVLDDYKMNKKKLSQAHISIPKKDDTRLILNHIKRVCNEMDLPLQTCAEEDWRKELDLPANGCINREHVERITGRQLIVQEDKTQRMTCNCLQSIDIGAYSTCPGKCVYCYANKSNVAIQKAQALHDVHAPLLTGQRLKTDKVTDRKTKSIFNENMPLITLDK